MSKGCAHKSLHVTLRLRGTWHLRARSSTGSGRLFKGARAPVGLLRFGAAPRAVRGCARRGAGQGQTQASGWCVCTVSGGAHAAALALDTLAPGEGGLGAAGAGLDAPLEGFAAWVPPLASELPYPGRRAPRRLQAVSTACERCGARLGVRRGCSGVGAASDGAGRRAASLRRGWRVCTGSRGSRAAAPALGALNPGRGGLGAAFAALTDRRFPYAAGTKSLRRRLNLHGQQ